MKRILHRKHIGSPEGGVYMVRWTLLSLFGWKLLLHKFVRPDWTPCCHDHPWWFVTFILWGGYEEVIETVAGDRSSRITVIQRPGRIRFRPATHRHYVQRLLKRTAWTLVLRGKPIRQWGFWTHMGFIPFPKFWASDPERQVAWCEDISP